MVEGGVEIVVLCVVILNKGLTRKSFIMVIYLF